MPRPNILMILADQLSCEMLGCYGNHIVRTPNLDWLAQNGVLHTNNYVQGAVCMPSRASIFTGTYPSICGVRMNGIPLDENKTTIADCFYNAGYRTFAAGKLHFTPQCNSNDPDVSGYRCECQCRKNYFGFEEFLLSDDNRVGPYAQWIKKNYPQYYDAIVDFDVTAKPINGVPDCYIGEYPAEIHQSNWVADRTIDFLKNIGDENFFVVCSFSDPHHPFNPPEPYASMYDDADFPVNKSCEEETAGFPKTITDVLARNGVANYGPVQWRSVKSKAYGMVTLMDDAIGRVLDELRESGLMDNTVILFTSDHGEMLGGHNLLYKMDMHYDELINTPLLWHFPQNFRAGTQVNCLTQSLDLMPTLLDLADLRCPPNVQGCSMKDVLLGKSDRIHDYVMTEQVLDFPGPVVNVHTVVTENYKYTYRTDGDIGQLFDRKNDPDELHNLWDEENCREIRMNMSEKLLRALMEAQIHPWNRQTKY